MIRRLPLATAVTVLLPGLAHAAGSVLPSVSLQVGDLRGGES